MEGRPNSERIRKVINATNGKYLIKVFIGILLTIVFAATSLIVADTRSGITSAALKIEVLQKEKLDKERYYSDIREIKQALGKINEKLDRLRK